MTSKAIRLGLKRAIDIGVAVLILFTLATVTLIVAVAVRIRLGSPVLFRQTRPGFMGQPFEVIKFRSMRDVRDDQGNWLPDEARLTSFGRALRRTSLDELPQLLNVIRGDMSLVGPRPLLMEYLDLYTPEQQRRHAMRPGITGLAQVSGRNQLGWEDRFDLDTWYVDNWSLGLDIRILARTVRKVVVSEGISADGVATMTAYAGPKERAK